MFWKRKRHKGAAPIIVSAPGDVAAPADEMAAPAVSTCISAAEYRVPSALCTRNRLLSRVLVVGQCLVEGLAVYIREAEDGADADFILLNNAGTMPELPRLYDVQILAVALRSILPDLAHARLPFDQPEAFQALFEACCARMTFLLENGCAYGDRFPIFVGNLLVPQQNSLGRLAGRRDLRNLSYFVRQLNERLEDWVDARPNCYLLDLEDINRTVGAMRFQDDVLWQSNHGAALTDADHEHDRGRLHTPAPIDADIPLDVHQAVAAIWAEIKAQYRTLRRTGAVKLVIVDLDDTLWRGILAEQDAFTQQAIEGWPLGVAEALLYLKQRGVILAIASRNDEAKIRAIWEEVWGGRLRLDDFSSVRINWRPKVQTVGEIIAEVNVLPDSVVFIDDNPVERASVAAAYPGIRTLGADLYGVRRTLLWSAETQPAVMTQEAARRGAMVAAQIERDGARKAMSREAFLASLAITYTPVQISDCSHPQFERALELLNKTNQFNTTGRRWDRPEIERALAAGLRIHAFEVTDRYTAYGLVGMALVQDGVIEQFVMSCRVIGLDVELTCLSALKRPGLIAKMVATPRNGPCRDLYARAGFEPEGDHWICRAG